MSSFKRGVHIHIPSQLYCSIMYYTHYWQVYMCYSIQTCDKNWYINKTCISSNCFSGPTGAREDETLEFPIFSPPSPSCQLCKWYTVYIYIFMTKASDSDSSRKFPYLHTSIRTTQPSMYSSSCALNRSRSWWALNQTLDGNENKTWRTFQLIPASSPSVLARTARVNIYGG